jgi:hypothetical protein
MRFNGRKKLVKNVQKLLGVKDDGIAGKITWTAIERRLIGRDSNSTIEQRILNVQKHLRLKVDGKDGSITWNAIRNALVLSSNNTRPAPVAPVAPVAPINQSFKYSETVKLSNQTNGSFSQKIRPEAIVLHHTGGNYAGSIDWTNRIHDTKGNRLYASYHCIIARDGRRIITNEDDNRAYHAGISNFKGRTSLNMWSLGVAWERDTYSEPLSDAAIESALEYILPRMLKWRITPDWVTDHRTVSPGRKNDISPKEYERFMKILRERYSKT